VTLKLNKIEFLNNLAWRCCKHLDGRALVLTHPAGEILAPGSVRAIAKEGMPIHKNPFEKGNLYIKFDVVFPENNSLSEEAIKVS